jgi:hypothetical protein
MSVRVCGRGLFQSASGEQQKQKQHGAAWTCSRKIRVGESAFEK